MKLQDPLYGISIANGAITFNLLYSIYIFKMIMENQKGLFQYDSMLFWLGLSHVTSFLLSLATFYFQIQKFTILSKTLMVIKNALYQGVFFYVSVQYFKVKDTIDDAEVKDWIFLELITYFSQIFSIVVFFFFYSLLFQDKNYMFQEQDMNQQDSIVIQKISQYGSEILVTVFFMFRYANQQCDSNSYKDIMLLFIAFNLLLFSALAISFRYLQLPEDKQQKRRMKCFHTKIMKIVVLAYFIALVLLYGYLFFRLATTEICIPVINFWLKGNIYIIPGVLLIMIIAICQRNRQCIKNIKKKIKDNLNEEVVNFNINSKTQSKQGFSFRDDFYAIVYYGFIYIDDFDKQRETGYILTEDVLGKIYFNCILIFTLQMTLVYFAFVNLIQSSNTFVIPNNMQTLLTRFVCSIILHIQIEGDLKQSINMIEFSMNIVKRKKRKVPQILVAAMQFIGALLTEIINILLLCSLTDVKDIIINMVAFSVIAQLDDFYATSLQQFKLRELTINATLNRQQEIEVQIELSELSQDKQNEVIQQVEEADQEVIQEDAENQVEKKEEVKIEEVIDNYVKSEEEKLLVQHQEPQNQNEISLEHRRRQYLFDSSSNSINAKFENCADKIIFIFCYNLIYKIVKALYESFYYYFMPFMIVIIALFQNFYNDLVK